MKQQWKQHSPAVFICGKENGTTMSLLNHQDDAKWDEKLINFRKHWTVSCRGKYGNTSKPHRQWGSRKPLFILQINIKINIFQNIKINIFQNRKINIFKNNLDSFGSNGVNSPHFHGNPSGTHSSWGYRATLHNTNHKKTCALSKMDSEMKSGFCT